jgi:hypothetical protein
VDHREEVVAVNVAAIYFGLVGGMTGLFWGVGILTLCPGSCPLAISDPGRMEASILGAGVAFFLAMAGMSGWLLAFARPGVGGWMMVGAGAGSLVAAFPLFVIPGSLLLIGGGLRLVATRSQPEPGQLT